MPTTTKKTNEPAGKTTRAVSKNKKATTANTTVTTTTSEQPRRTKKKVSIESADLVVVGPVATAPEADSPTTAEIDVRPATPPTAPIAFESGTRPTRAGNAFELTVTSAGDLVLRYQDRGSWFGPRMQAVVIVNPGHGQTVEISDLVLNGAVHETCLTLPAGTRAVALAFTGNGNWDSNDSRNYHVDLGR